MADFVKLSALVDSEFTVTKAGGYQFQLWDTASNRMLVSEKWENGYRKVYVLETDKGILNAGSGQLATLLEATYKNGTADINGKTFAVKSNGKSGMDIRYFFNLVRNAAPVVSDKDTVHPVDEQEPIRLEDIPF